MSETEPTNRSPQRDRVDQPSVSVLIVNYNGAAHLSDCLTALEHQTLPRERFEVIVVDNASTDDSVKRLHERFPAYQLITLDRNTGFAEGNNIAARLARGSCLALLNNDTIPDPYWLEELLRVADENPGAAVASKLVFAHDPRTLNSTGLFLLRDGRGADRGFRHRDLGQHEATETVFAGCAAALLIPTPPPGEPVFDSRYFVYYEDLDAQWRAAGLGRRTVYAPRSLVRHVHGAAAGDHSPLFHFFNERNRALTSLRHGDLFLAGYATAVLVAKAGLGLLRGRSTVAMAVLSYLWHAPRVLVERYLTRCWSEAGRCG